MTGAELRALCLSFPDVTEKVTWGDAEHAGDMTFRIRDKIFVITGDETAPARASGRASSSRRTCSPPSPTRSRARPTWDGSAGSASDFEGAR